ncbi:hypothetical protein [Sphingomonas oligoaromativorans]|uniref:hypothetical protein n=1 Tax=Sphingomonas oligoaromativorans TaxID=575322 RepID=UPI00141DB858|nr:hypothetical protein [Sphingomonas oligoaromativorans]NIJ34308.1 hypothetical protein [Sphingomonas oligoaromativorans]
MRRDWTFEEMAVIRRHYPTGKATACLPLLPGRSKQAIRNQAYLMRRTGLSIALPLVRPRPRVNPAPLLTAFRTAEPSLGAPERKARLDPVHLQERDHRQRDPMTAGLTLHHGVRAVSETVEERLEALVAHVRTLEEQMA